MKTKTIFSAVLLSIGASAQAADQTYDWVSTGPGDYSATITLNSSSSAGGSVSDIVSASVTLPIGTLPVFPIVNFLDVNGPFTWNASEITAMDLQFGTFLQSSIYTSFGDTLTIGSLRTGEIQGGVGDGVGPDIDYIFEDNGSWQAAPAGVPDAGSSAVLLGMAVAGLGGWRRFRN